MLLEPPAIILTHLITIVCNLVSCDTMTNPPVPFKNGSRQDRRLEGDDLENEIRLPPFVNTKLGVVEGYYMTVVSGRQIYAFEGIPYAEPPIGENRFRAPKPKERWIGILEAKDPGPICMQLYIGRLMGAEDCLRLNVFTPGIPSDNSKAEKFPVIIYVHGGLHVFGAGSWYGPAYLLEEQVILVTFNYRLGILGAMTTGDEVASGNWGLKDQALLINWVYENIEAFGGDRNRITLSGQSSGAVDTIFHLMSPLVQGKIARALCLSGSAYNFWGLNSLEEAKGVSLASARVARCPVIEGSQALIDCMRRLDAELLVSNQLLTISSGFPAPSIEPNVPGAFITESPDEIYARGGVPKIPIIFTGTSDEANVVIARLEGSGGLPFLRWVFDADAPFLLGLRRRVPQSKEQEIVQKVKRFYGIRDTDLVIPREFFTRGGSDRYFTSPFHRAVQMHSQIAPTYAGVFSYPSNIGIAAQAGVDPREFGVSHNEDIIFFLNSTLGHEPISRFENNFAVTKLMVNMYSNFAATGKPTFLASDNKMYNFWEANYKNPDNLNFLDINEEVKMIPDPYKESSKFWESLGISDSKPYIKLRS